MHRIPIVAELVSSPPHASFEQGSQPSLSSVNEEHSIGGRGWDGEVVWRLQLILVPNLAHPQALELKLNL